MAQKFTAREYAEEMKKVHGADAKVTWMTIQELLDMYTAMDNKVMAAIQAYEDDRDQEDTKRSIISTFIPF